LHTGKKPGTFPETKGKRKKNQDGYSRSRAHWCQLLFRREKMLQTRSSSPKGLNTHPRTSPGEHRGLPDTHSHIQPAWRSSCTSRGRYFDSNIININAWQTAAKVKAGRQSAADDAPQRSGRHTLRPAEARGG